MDQDAMSLLIEMRREQREDHQTLVTKVDEGFAASAEATGQMVADFQKHELNDEQRFGQINLRLQPLEGLRTSVKWVFRTAAGAVVLFVIDAVLHLFRWR